jgi:ABC-type phosphate/phosphonate transport system permease subunit
MIKKNQETKFQEILARRKKAKVIRYILYFLAFLLIIGSIQSTIIEDTDWARIGGVGSVIKALARFLPPDLSVFKHMVGPPIETTR